MPAPLTHPPLTVPLVDSQGKVTRPWAATIDAIGSSAASPSTPGQATIHNDLDGRQEPDCHTISAVSGLQESLSSITNDIIALEDTQESQDAQILNLGQGLISVSNQITNTNAIISAIDVKMEDLAASSVTFTPVGSVSATDVQAAIAEVDSGKMVKPTLTTNVIPKATGANTIGDSAVSDNGTIVAVASRQLQVTSARAPAAKATTTTTGNTVQEVIRATAKTSVTPADGLGPQMLYTIENNAGTSYSLAATQAVRDGADNTGKLQIRVSNAGTFVDALSISPLSQIVTSYSINPVSSGAASLGTSSLRFNNLDAFGVYTESILPRSGNNLSLLDTTGVIRVRITPAGAFDLSGHTTFSVDDTYNIGSATLKPHYLFVSQVYTPSIVASGSNLTLTGTNIVTSNPLLINNGFTAVGTSLFSRANPSASSLPGIAIFGRYSDNAGAGQVGFAQTTAENVLMMRHSSGKGEIRLFAGATTDPGKLTIGTGDLNGTIVNKWATFVDGTSTFYTNTDSRPNNNTVGSEIRFFPTYNTGASGKQWIGWWNTAGDTRRALIGYREGALPDTNDKDLRIVSTYPSGTAMATGLRGVRIGTALDTTSETSTGSFTVAPYNNTYVGIWPGSLAAGSRTNSNYTLLSGNTSTWLNAPSESGTVGIAINDASMMEIKNTLITCFTGAAGAMTVNGDNFAVNAATADLSGTTTTHLPGVTFSAFPLYTKQPVLTTTTSGLTSGNYSWNMDAYRDVLFSSAMTGAIIINLSNARGGRTNTFAVFRGATAYTIQLNLTGVNFIWTGGASNSDGLTIQTSYLGTASRWYAFTLTWLSASTCLVARPVL